MNGETRGRWGEKILNVIVSSINLQDLQGNFITGEKKRSIEVTRAKLIISGEADECDDCIKTLCLLMLLAASHTNGGSRTRLCDAY